MKTGNKPSLGVLGDGEGVGVASSSPSEPSEEVGEVGRGRCSALGSTSGTLSSWVLSAWYGLVVGIGWVVEEVGSGCVRVVVGAECQSGVGL